jgi:hypothetical protein
MSGSDVLVPGKRAEIVSDNFVCDNIDLSRYRWEKNGKEFNWQVYDNRISQQPGRGTLVITQPKREDIGKATRTPAISTLNIQRS